jgi:hypothetical protein
LLDQFRWNSVKRCSKAVRTYRKVTQRVRDQLRFLCSGLESFFSLLQKNVLDRQRWTIRQELRLAITTWIERTYRRRRRQRRLGKLTPIEYETINRTALIAA